MQVFTSDVGDYYANLIFKINRGIAPLELEAAMVVR